MKAVLFFLLLISSQISYSVIWPGAAPCDTTLQLCISGSGIGATVEIQSNIVIDEEIDAVSSVSIVAGIGYEPVFADGRGITILHNSSSVVTVKGLTFNRGHIRVVHSAGDTTVNILNNHILNGEDHSAPIIIESYSTTNLVANIRYNTVNTHVEFGGGDDNYGAISVVKDSSSGIVSGDIFNNVIKTTGTATKGINLFADGTGAVFDINVTGNEVFGGSLGALHILHSSDASSEFDISSNAFYKQGNTYEMKGINVYSEAGTANLDIVNNTVVQASVCMQMADTGGVLNSNIRNNIIAYCSDFGFYFTAGSSVTTDYNISYMNSNNVNYFWGPHALLNTDPQIINMQNARLQATSPALEAGDPLALFAVADAPPIDADGLMRVKKSSHSASNAIDIGAYESGDFAFTHEVTADNMNAHSTPVDSPYLNDFGTLDDIHVTSNNGFQGSFTGNNDNEGIWYSGGKWRIFNEGFTDLNLGIIFNIFQFGSSLNTFEHTVSAAGSNISQIDRAGLNGNTDKILQLTQHWTGFYNPHPPGIFNDGSNWFVKNFDLADLPNNSNFNIYYQDESKSAFEHIAVDQNTGWDSTLLNHPLLNGNPCAQIQVTQSGSQSVFNDTPVGVFYESIGERWHIINQDGSQMLEGAAFHVLINPGQIAECFDPDLIFASGFD